MTGKQDRVWLITGASRGLGREIALAALNRGDAVIAGVRRPQAMELTGPRLLTTILDVTDEEQAMATVKAGLARFGRIDVVVNNAGYGLLGAIEETGADETRRLFATNVEGVLNVTRAALPVLRAQGAGHIVNLSSLGGFGASAGAGVYGATKFAVEGLSEALAAELAPLGIRVTIVEPGFFRTEFLTPNSITYAGARIADYDALLNRDLSRANGRQRGDPARAAEAILAVVDHPDPPLRLPLGPDALTRIEAKLAFVQKELDRWRNLSLSTDHGRA